MLKENAFVKKKYNKLFIAAILGWIVSLLGGMADSVIAGMFLDSNAVAAVGLITPISSIIYFVSILIACGCSIMYSTALGAFQKERSEKIAGMGLLVSIVIGIILGVIVAVFKKQVLEFYGCTGVLYDYAYEYYFPYIFHAFASPLIWFIYHIVSYDGDERVVLACDTTMAIGNALLSYFLVQSKGIIGLSLGTVFSELAGFLVILIHFLKKSNSIKFKFFFNFKDFIKMVKLSSASSLTTLYVGVIDVIFNKFIISQYGESYLPAYTVVNAVLNVAAVLMCAMTAGMVFVSISYGENNIYALKRVMKIVNRNSFLFGAAFSVILFLIAPYWAGIYAIEDAVVQEASVFAGRIVPLTYIAGAFVFEYLGYYPLINKSMAGNMLGINYMLVGPIVLAIPSGLLWGFNGMTVGFALTPIFAIVVEYIYFAIRKQLKKAPLLLENNNENEAHFDIRLDETSIVEVRDRVNEFLKENNVPSQKIMEILIILEDTLVYIKEKNEHKTICECTVLVNDEHVRLITKDNGKIFDMIQEADNSIDLRCYVLARMMENASEKSNTTTISFNRNTYIWQLNEDNVE